MKYTCSACGSEDIILWEWMGAYDGWMATKCKTCGKFMHRMGGEIETATQREDYGAVDFLMKDGTMRTNLFAYDPDYEPSFF